MSLGLGSGVVSHSIEGRVGVGFAMILVIGGLRERAWIKSLGVEFGLSLELEFGFGLGVG